MIEIRNTEIAFDLCRPELNQNRKTHIKKMRFKHDQRLRTSGETRADGRLKKKLKNVGTSQNEIENTKFKDRYPHPQIEE